MQTIEWLGHASFRIKNGLTLYIDPWKLEKGEEKADLILISHSHFDHFQIEDIAKIRTDQTKLIVARDCLDQLKGEPIALFPDEVITENNITIQATAAYNKDKEFHPRDKQWLGFLITINGERIYYAGDTDLIPEMENLGKVDIALLPIGGTYTMTADEAVEATRRIQPGYCIPYHYGDIVGSKTDAERFKAQCPYPCDILPKM